jgi:hypothetical protein
MGATTWLVNASLVKFPDIEARRDHWRATGCVAWGASPASSSIECRCVKSESRLDYEFWLPELYGVACYYRVDLI